MSREERIALLSEVEQALKAKEDECRETMSHDGMANGLLAARMIVTGMAVEGGDQ